MIEAQDLTRRYGQVTAVDRLSLKVAEGELVVLLGGSGSGKTTTLKMVNRLIEPTSGRVLIEGEDAGAIPAHELRRRIGYVFQRVGLFPHMTIGDNVGIALAWRRESPSCSSSWSSTRVLCAIDILMNCREESSSVSVSRARSRPRRG